MIPQEQRPDCTLVGTDGNVFSLIGTVKKCLVKAGFKKEAKEMQTEVFSAESYDKALCIFGKYVNIG